MVFIWDKTEDRERHTATISLGEHLSSINYQGKKPDRVKVTDGEIEYAKDYGVFAGNHWGFERYIANDLRNCLVYQGRIQIVSDCKLEVY